MSDDSPRPAEIQPEPGASFVKLGFSPGCSPAFGLEGSSVIA